MGMLRNDIDRSQLFIRNNDFRSADYTNSGDDPMILQKGLVIGRISASGKVLPLVSTATDGTADPLGILADDYEVASGATVSVTYCFDGEVAKQLVKLDGTQTLDTVVTGKGRIGDLIVRNTHITLTEGTELTGFDN